jgi:hypothetical protein
MGLDQHKQFHRYHRVLSRASWSSREVSRILLGLLVEAFVSEGDPLVVGIDQTLERHYGKKILARGVYRDPVRSTHENFVKSSGLRWVCVMMLLVEVPWASRAWALPFLSALAPSERYAAGEPGGPPRLGYERGWLQGDPRRGGSGHRERGHLPGALPVLEATRAFGSGVGGLR